MSLIYRASDAASLPRSRELVRSPDAFEGALDELVERYVLPNLPTAEAVRRFHHSLSQYVRSDDPLFFVRAAAKTERRREYTTAAGSRFKATDNAPAWWVHAALVQEHQIADEAFSAVIASMPAHLFEVAANSAPTANAAGWHVAHVFPVKDGDTEHLAWPRRDLIRRFVRNIHPCNYFLVPKAEWRRWGGDSRVIGFFAALYAERYADVWQA
ncbi:MAG: hypothetical protein M3081_12645 [Gemmatimonadota bacterium]|nr:hypothetical protein [Gemmatimonadota bacterium]